MILQPLLAGLSVGGFCLTYCFPFMGSMIVAEERTVTKNTQVILQFLVGRLMGYLCFGFAAGYLGKRFDAAWLQFATDLSFIALSIILFLYLLGLLKETRLFCYSSRRLNGASPALMGFFMGINICPPFLLSVAYIFKQQSAFYGIAYFALFFISSSVYFLPLIFIGLAARAKEFRTVARLSGFLVALFFFAYGIYSIIRNS